MSGREAPNPSPLPERESEREEALVYAGEWARHLPPSDYARHLEGQKIARALLAESARADRLAERLAEVEGERDEALRGIADKTIGLKALELVIGRAERAEAQLRVAREALVEIVNVENGVTGHGNPYPVARRALARLHSEPPAEQAEVEVKGASE